MREFRAKLNVVALKNERPISPGYTRSYDQCKVCDKIYYHDYVPFSLSTLIMVLPCGHGVTERYTNGVRVVGTRKG